MVKPKADAPTETVTVGAQTKADAPPEMHDYIRWIKVGGRWKDYTTMRYPDGMPRWVPESMITNPKSDSTLRADEFIAAVYDGAWKFGPMLSLGAYGVLIVYRDEVPG